MGSFNRASGLEDKVEEKFKEWGIEYEYEPIKLTWYENYPRARCEECGSKNVSQQRSYTPDFVIGRSIIVEVKGRLTRRDRKILSGVKRANPGKDIRIIFDKNNKINPGSTTRYSEWATQFEIPCILIKDLTKEWLDTLH